MFYFARCIERLCDLHIASENYTEAGYTVLKHAELLEVIIQQLVSEFLLGSIHAVTFVFVCFFFLLVGGGGAGGSDFLQVSPANNRVFGS